MLYGIAFFFQACATNYVTYLSLPPITFFLFLFPLLVSLSCLNLLLGSLSIKVYLVLFQEVLQLLNVKITQVEEAVPRVVGVETLIGTRVELSTFLYITHNNLPCK